MFCILHLLPYTHTHIHICTYIAPLTHIHTHTCTHARMHARTHARTHAHTLHTHSMCQIMFCILHLLPYSVQFLDHKLFNMHMWSFSCLPKDFCTEFDCGEIWGWAWNLALMVTHLCCDLTLLSSTWLSRTQTLRVKTFANTIHFYLCVDVKFQLAHEPVASLITAPK